MPGNDLILNDPDRLISWAQAELGVTFFDDARAIGWGTASTIRSAAIYDRWSGNDCCVHLVSDNQPGWLSRRFLAAGFHFPFVLAKLRRVTGLVSASNTRAHRLNLHFGFRDEGLLRAGAEDGGDLVIMGMLREECVFLPRGTKIKEVTYG